MRKSLLAYTLRFYPYDRDLVEWLATLPAGRRGQIMKSALRRSLVQPVAAPPFPDREALLPEIRQVVEAAVYTALAGSHLIVEDSAAPTEGEMVDDFLSALDAALTLEV